MDAELRAAFVDAGAADAGTYTPPGGSPVACSMLVDRGLSLIAVDQSSINANQTTITLFLEEIGQRPAKGGVIQIGSEIFTIDRLDTIDESRAVCVVKVGT